MHRMQGTRGEAHDAYSCQPCSVDPRPEGALLYEERLEQCDLVVSEGPDLRSADPDHTERDTFAQERYG